MPLCHRSDVKQIQDSFFWRHTPNEPQRRIVGHVLNKVVTLYGYAAADDARLVT